MLAGSFMSARIAGSLASVTVANAGWIAASSAQMYAMTGPNVTGPASVPSYSVDRPWVAM